MTVWDWMRDFEEQARLAGDLDRLNLARLHGAAYSHRQSDPDRMLALLGEGRRQAVHLNEPWWILFFDHWVLETNIYYRDDYRAVIDLGVRLTLELRKPAFSRHPLRFSVYCNLVAAYLCVDPRGYESAIREALVYLGTLTPPDTGDAYLLQARRHWFAYELGHYDEAQRLALEELAMADADPDRHTARHHEVDSYKALCWVCFRRGDWTALAGYALAGEDRARDLGYRYERSLFLLWRGLLAAREGRHEEGQRLCRQGTTLMSRLGQPPGESYYDALAALHELSEDWQAAWQVRQGELATCQGKGQLAYEVQVYLKRLRLLVKLGQPLADEVKAAEAAIARLRRPDWYVEQLKRVLANDGY